LEAEKQLCNTRGVLTFGDAALKGYEIHAGVSFGKALEKPAAILEGARPDGAVSEDGQILGTYVHGLFEAPDACEALLKWAGVPAPQRVDYAAVRERAIERVADSVESHLDLERILSLIT
jgi:adenosylcobyric acid synthase